jgi:hypothetical protein
MVKGETLSEKTLTVSPAKAREQRLADITKLMADVNIHLVSHGFQPHRVGEHLHPNGRHVRKGYAGGEWTITVSTKVDAVYLELETLRFDSRLVDRPLPTAEELALRLCVKATD